MRIPKDNQVGVSDYYVEDFIDDKWLGKEIWVTDYRHRTASEKAVRHIPPTKVLYESRGRYTVLKKNGTLGKRSIKDHDNTSDRSWTDTDLGRLKVFDNEEECTKCYEELCVVVYNLIQVELERLQTYNQVVISRL